MRIGRSSGSWSVAGALLRCCLPPPSAAATGAAADNLAFGRRLYLDKAQCSYCHGWAADGAGEPQSNGGAANLRQSFLNREQLSSDHVRPAGDADAPLRRSRLHRQALLRRDGGRARPQAPALPPSTTLQKREVEAIADYLLAKFIGRGAVTREECQEVFGAGGRACGQYPAKP